MKRKDFLRKMKDRRRGGALEERRPEERRRVDWRTIRQHLPGPEDDAPDAVEMQVGELDLLPDGVRLRVTSACWVRGYRLFAADDGMRAEFQYRPAKSGSEPPPGATALQAGDEWQPS